MVPEPLFVTTLPTQTQAKQRQGFRIKEDPGAPLNASSADQAPLSLLSLSMVTSDTLLEVTKVPQGEPKLWKVLHLC
jgi:hypothetical protein